MALADAIKSGDRAKISRLKKEQSEVTRRFYDELHKLPEDEKQALINRQAKMLEQFRMPQELDTQ
jgi:hypothetical protein